jgi:hypothetical protein
MPALSQSLEFVVNTTSTVSIMYPNNTSTMMVYVSDKVKGDGYYGGSDGLHTVTYTCAPTFVGTVTMQASLAAAPTDADWFTVPNTDVRYTTFNDRSTSTVDYYNFQGNYVWLRSRVAIADGAVEVIHYNH